MLIKNLTERIHPRLADHPFRLCVFMVSNQKEKCTPAGFGRPAWSTEVQQSDMNDDVSSEGGFILAPSIAPFKVFDTA
jgi:hypothetical protein